MCPDSKRWSNHTNFVQLMQINCIGLVHSVAINSQASLQMFSILIQLESLSFLWNAKWYQNYKLPCNSVGAQKSQSGPIAWPKGAERNPDFFLFTVCSVWKNKSWYFCLIPIIVLHYGWFGDLLPKNTLHSKNSRNQKHYKYS